MIKDQTRREPALELAIARELLEQVRLGCRGPAIRVYRPLPAVAFGRRDALLPGFAQAVEEARAHGFTPVVRPQGGRAAAYHEGCLVIDQVFAAEDAMTGIQERFAQAAALQAKALRSLGVDARVGAIPGEYCPGAFTVNAGGRRKLIGGAQRVVRGAWLLSSVVVAERAATLRAVLTDVYAALGLAWDPATVGAVADEVPGTTIAAIETALLAEVSDPLEPAPAAVQAELLTRAREDLGRYRAG